MDKDSRQKLHNLLVTEQLYSKPFNEFESQFSNPASQKKLYGLLKSEQLYSKSESDFNKQFFADVSTPQKKNPIPTAGTSPSVVTKPSSVSNQPAKPAPSASSSVASKPVSVIPAQSQGKLLMQEKQVKVPGTSFSVPSTEKYNVLNPNWYPKQTKEDITLLTRNARDRAKYLATDIKGFNNDAKILEQDIAKFNALAESNPNNTQLIALQNDLNKRQAEIEERSKKLQSGAKEIDAAQATINRKAIENYNQKAKQGNWGGYAWNKIVEGVGDIAGGADEFIAMYEEVAANALDIFGIETDITKEKPYALLAPDMYRKEAKKRMQNIQMPVIESWKSEGTTAEYAQELEKSSSLAKALGGVTGSVPAMIAGPAGMLLQSYGSFYREVESDPVLKNLPRQQLDAVALPLSLGMAWLEKTGLASVLGKGTGPIAKLVTKALLKVPKNAPMTLVKKTFLELAEKEAQRISTSKIGGVATKVAKSGVGKVAKRLGGGALGEAETEAEQGVLEDELKRLSNYANDSEAFKVAEFASKEYIDKHLEEAKLGAIGSLILGGPILAVQSVAQGKAISDDDYVAMRDLILDPEQLKLKQAQIALAIAGGQVTKEEGLNELQQLDATRKILKTIPDNLSVESQRQAYGILAKNAKLQQEIDNTAKGIEGKDPNLVTGYIDYMKKKQEEIDANNAELAKLPQTPIKEKPQQGIPEPDEWGRITFEFGSEDEIPNELKALTPAAKGSSTDEKGNKKITLSFSQEQIDPIRDAIQKQTTSQVPVQPEAGTGLQVAEGEPQAEPQVPTQEGQGQEVAPAEQPKVTTIQDSIDADNTFTMRGNEGNLFVDDNGQVLFESGEEIVELGNISDVAESALSDFGIEPKAPVAIEIGDDGSIQVSGKKYINVAQAPMDAITFDEDGNVKSVRLETENGQSRFFRGKRAESIAYQYALQNFEKNATDEQLDNAINQATETTATQTTTGEVTGKTETATVDEGAKQEKLDLDEEVSLLEQLLEQEETAPTQSAGISISSDTDIEELRNRSQSRSQQATTQEDKDSANTRVKIIDSAKKAIKTLKSIFPDVDIVIHDDEGSYNAAMSEVNGVAGSRGNFFIDTTPDGKTTGRININLSKANSRTVAHEIAHGILLKTFGDNKNLFNDFRTRLSKVIKGDVNQQLNDFANQYVDPATGELLDVNHEEFLAELTAILEQQETKVSVTTMQKLGALINEFVSKITGGKFKPFEDTKNTKDVVDFFNNISSTIREGGEIQELNGGGEVGTFNFTSRSSLDAKEAPSVANDSRSFIRDLVEDVDMIDFNGRKFVTNMYDYTTAGTTDLGNGLTINMLGGKNYVPYMMSLQDKKIGDVSNLAAFNTKAQAESFARNAIEGDASLFAPHSGTLSESWQFQQHTFAELVNLILDKNIMSNTELIDLFNKTISSEVSKKAFNAFKSKYGKNISNFNSFKNNPKKIVELLDIKNNYSPNLRKALNNAISADKTFQKAIGVKNKEEFFKRIMDPLNDGVQGGEIINLVEFDPKTFQIVQTKPGSLDHHPSFGWAILSKINGIYQPTKFYQSSNVTESYVKYNKSGEQVSRKAEESNFDKKNVSSSAGSIPKVAEFIKQSEVKSRSQLPSNDAQRIVNLARANGFSDQAISNVLEKRGFNQGAIDIALGKSTPATKKAPSAQKILGIKPKVVTVDEMASLKSQLRLQAKAAKTAYDFAEAARKLVATYIKNNVQGALSPADQKAIFRAMEGKLDTPENKKKMIDKITGILQASEGKIAIKELDALGRMLKSMEKGSKLGAKAVADQIKSVVATIKAMGVKNQLKPAQVRLLLNGMAKNLMNATVRDTFLASAQRVLNNAQYAEELLGARKIRTAIRKTLKTGKEIIDVETSVRNFLKLDPKMVEDLDEYMEYANEIFNAVRNVQVKDGNTLGKRAAVLANINAYAAEQNKIQDEINKNYLLDEYNYLVEAGLISGDMSLSEIQSYIASIEENPESSDSTKSDIIREFTKNAFEGFANTVNEMLEDGELDEQDVDFDMVKKFTEMDIESLPLDQQLAAVESLENFIVNGVTSRMGAILQGYTGVTNASKNAESGMKARPLSYGFIGRLAYLKKITTKGVIGNLLGGIAAIGDLYNNLEAIYIAKTDSLITGLFRSTTMGIKFMKDSGFSGVVRGFVQGKKIANDFAKKYADKFEKSKPNGKAFNDASNVFERGIFADLSRTIKDGNPEQIKKEFDRRMKQLRLTIDELRKTGKKELIEKADLYDSVYQKVKNAKNIEEVSMNIDPINQAAVKEFQDMWRKYYSEFRKMAADYYNIILDEDVNYTPDMYEKLAEDMSDDLITKGSFKMAFDVISTEKVGTFKKNQRIDGLPVNKNTREINRVRDYDFDFNNINALEKTLVDVRTTPSVQQYMGYVNSPYFKEIFPDFDDREMVKKRLKFNIDSLRERQDTYSSKEAKKINRFVSWLSKYGTRIGLGSLASAPKQSIPMIANTAINLANDLGSFGMGIADFWNDDAITFLENSGYGISLRGAESQTSIDFAEKLIERANQGKVGDFSEKLAKLGDIYIEKFLKYPDVTVANMAWLGYYRSKLKSMGYDMDKFDWKTHELNEEAADFAEFKVQDQQNMNISELGGKLLASKDATTKIIRQLLFPFASYQFNLKDKNNRNITMLTSKTSSNQEKITSAKSLASGMVEAYMFQTIQGIVGVLLLKAAYNAIGYEEPEEEKTNGIMDAIYKAMPFVRSTSPNEKRDDSIFIGKSIFEFVAPVPNQLEYVTLRGLNELMDVIQGGTPEQQIKEKKKQEKEASGETGRKRRLRFGEEEDKEAAKIKDRMDQKFRFFAREEQDVIQTLGDIVGGVPSVGVEALYDFGLRSIEAYSGSFEDKYGEYEYSEEQKKILKQSLIPRALVTFNIAPREFLTISNNIVKAVNKKAKEDAKAAKKEESARRTRF
jgi:hypothetical protein